MKKSNQNSNLIQKDKVFIRPSTEIVVACNSIRACMELQYFLKANNYSFVNNEYINVADKTKGLPICLWIPAADNDTISWSNYEYARTINTEEGTILMSLDEFCKTYFIHVPKNEGIYF
jgi:hypothetical protein